MSAYARLPFSFLLFWFIIAPKELLVTFARINTQIAHVLSLPLLLRTFFHPLKNEYRAGLIGFSMIIGIMLKTVILLGNAGIMLIVLVLEVCVLLGFLFVPFGTLYLLTL